MLVNLGDGIHMAIRDLDIRGAGNMWWNRGGFIADLGCETYREDISESCVHELNGMDLRIFVPKN